MLCTGLCSCVAAKQLKQRALGLHEALLLVAQLAKREGWDEHKLQDELSAYYHSSEVI